MKLRDAVCSRGLRERDSAVSSRCGVDDRGLVDSGSVGHALSGLLI